MDSAECWLEGNGRRAPRIQCRSISKDLGRDRSHRSLDAEAVREGSQADLIQLLNQIKLAVSVPGTVRKDRAKIADHVRPAKTMCHVLDC